VAIVGTLINQMPAANALTINDGTGIDLEIQAGGIYHILSDQGYANYQVINAGATVTIRSGGTIRVGNGIALAGLNNHLFAATSGTYDWETNAVFDWNIAGAFATAAVTYFPDAGASIIPVFNVSANTGNVGSNTATTFNGLFNANATVTFDNSGVKTFRNGITGNGNITGSSGAFRITGTTAKLGGSGSLTVPASGLGEVWLP
jgi:hypothetical protein